MTPPEFDRELSKARHLLENFFRKLTQFRAIATRYDKTARNFLAAIRFTAAIILKPRLTRIFSYRVGFTRGGNEVGG
jgi:transposase